MDKRAFVQSIPLAKRHSALRQTEQATTGRRPPCASASASEISRRKALTLSAALAATLLNRPRRGNAATAVKSPVLDYVVENVEYGYAFSVPSSGWTKQTATISSGRVATVFLREADGDSNINMVTTPVASDFQKLSSFGTLDNVLSTIIPPKQNDIEGELISADVDVKKNAYVIEYTVTIRGVKRHLITVFSLQPGRYLLTLTGQAKEEAWPEIQSTVRAVVDSYAIKILD